MSTTKDARKALKDSTGTTVNTLKRTNEANDTANPRPVKQTKTTLQAPPNLSTATPPSFLKDIILPDEDDVYPPMMISGLNVVWDNHLRKLQPNPR